MTNPRCQPWLDKWKPNDWRDDPLPPEATTIADDLPADAHEVLLLGCPWDLEMSPHVAMLLEFYDLLDEDKISLNRLGVEVKRLLSGWDADWNPAIDGARRSKWAEQCAKNDCNLMEMYISLLSHELKGLAS